MAFKEITDSSFFFKKIKEFEIIPFTQLKGMNDLHALSGENRIHYFIDNIEQPTIACIGHEKKFLHLKMLLIEGESYVNHSAINLKAIRSFYNEIINLGYDIIELCSNAKYDFTYETALRQNGFLRPVGQFSMPNTKIIDLSQEISFNRNWTRNIKKAKNNNLSFEVIENATHQDCKDFQKLYFEMTDRKSMSHTLSVKQIEALCSTDNFKLFFISETKNRVAGIIIYTINRHSGGGFAASSQKALELSASFFMYHSLLNYLKENQFSTFDMEKFVPSTNEMNSVFLFKNGIEGKMQILNGEWSWYKKSYLRPMMYFVKKHLMKKREL